jgi:hypothetical protein
VMTDTRDAPVTLDQFGDVLTDLDLARLMHRPARWPVDERTRARRRGTSPDLPQEIPGLKRRIRYRKQDVAYWMQTGRRQRKAS